MKSFFFEELSYEEYYFFKINRQIEPVYERQQTPCIPGCPMKSFFFEELSYEEYYFSGCPRLPPHACMHLDSTKTKPIIVHYQSKHV
jgi:hypothetical protein